MHKIAKALTRTSACNDGLTSKFCLVLGLQWGREGKRKLLNKLCVDYDYSCRFNGGVMSDPSKYISKCIFNQEWLIWIIEPYDIIDILPNGELMKVLPVGIQHSIKTKSILGNGVIIDAKHLLNDLNALANNGIDVKDRLYVSNR
jgi:adenylosuccinate synthase